MTFLKPIIFPLGVGSSTTTVFNEADFSNGFSVLEGPELLDHYAFGDEDASALSRLTRRSDTARSLTDVVSIMARGHYVTDRDLYSVGVDELYGLDEPGITLDDDVDHDVDHDGNEQLLAEYALDTVADDVVSSLQQDREIKQALYYELAGVMHHIWEQKIQLFSNEVEAMFKPYGLGKIKWRAKERQSTASKLARRETKGATVLDIEDAERVINDGIGMRIELDDPSPDGVRRFLKALFNIVRNERVTILDVDNYSGRYNAPYVPSETIHAFVGLLLTSTSSEVPLKGFKPWKIKGTGYTALQFDILVELSDGHYFRADLQVCGKEVAKVALAEHLPYKLLLHEYDYLEEQFPKIRALGDYCRSWGDEEIGVYLDYTSRCFAYAHARDLGQEAEKPVLPKQFQDEPLLDIFVLGDYYKRVVLNIG